MADSGPPVTGTAAHDVKRDRVGLAIDQEASRKPRHIFRFADHVIRHAAEGGIIYEAFCVAYECGAESGPQDEQNAAQDWALRHSGRTGHDLFRRVVTDHAHVTRVE
ncbi:hypothetical protein [Streptomyces sp. XD-27]|uniref:DUF7848 domain-containing protein n=1 Tax=Streptomyces sp. XD-27 TaxID=3062779 RepID=UPI0026F40E56|nr:hypothetical protein [Streptomyces sp. XD-27]WKX70536.1 hypothetical protein Q3Y56_11955 [Streptomyces sp. XD-27]